MSTCVFCKIAARQIPARIVLETDRCVAFLDAAPLAPGHVLLIPKAHATTIGDLAPDTLAEMSKQFGGLSKAIMSATGATGLNLLQNNGTSAGQVVMHVHFHLIPRHEGDGLGYRWNPIGGDAQRDDAMAEHIRRHLGT